MRRTVRLFPLLSVLFLLALSTPSIPQPDSKTLQLEPRDDFFIKLPKISVTADIETQEFTGVKIIFPKSEDVIIITTGDDKYVKNTSHGAEKTLYREPTEKAGYVSKFEAKELREVNEEFAGSLETFEKMLQKKQWGRCLFLDAYFPHFLNGYYYLICAIRNSTTALPRSARIPEQEYDISENSPKSDARIRQWRSAEDNIIKLRIASKELAHQLNEFQKKLKNIDDNEDVAAPKDLEEAFVVFVRVYFNLRPPSPIVFKKQRD
jgi:hypothetical protein